jgi:hypothetical protein
VLEAFTHAVHSEPEDVSMRIESGTVVRHGQLEIVVGELERDVDGARLRVTDDVGQRLLQNAQQRVPGE